MNEFIPLKLALLKNGKRYHLAKKLNVKRPKQYDFNNLEECKKFFEKSKDDFEGLVLLSLPFLVCGALLARIKNFLFYAE